MRSKHRLLQRNWDGTPREEGGESGRSWSSWGQAEGTTGFGKKEVPLPGLCLFLHQPKLLLSASSQKKGTEVYWMTTVCQDWLPTVDIILFTSLNLHYKVIIIIVNFKMRKVRFLKIFQVIKLASGRSCILIRFCHLQSSVILRLYNTVASKSSEAECFQRNLFNRIMLRDEWLLEPVSNW